MRGRRVRQGLLALLCGGVLLQTTSTGCGTAVAGILANVLTNALVNVILGGLTTT